MKLPHSIKVIDKLVARLEEQQRLYAKGVGQLSELSIEEQSALVVLLRFAKRVMAAKESVRALARAVAGDDDLNQEELSLDKP
jgi:hypothetical protein